MQIVTVCTHTEYPSVYASLNVLGMFPSANCACMYPTINVRVHEILTNRYVHISEI